MIDLKLFDIFATICVGFFTIILIIFFYFMFNKLFVRDRFNEKEFTKWLFENLLSKDIKGTGYVLLGSIFIYFFGIMAGDLTDRMTDSNNFKEKNYVLKELHWFSKIPNVGRLRKQSLIDSDEDLTTLGTSVFHSSSLVKKANNIMNTHFFLDSSYTSLVPTKQMQDSVKKYVVKPDENKDSDFDKFISLLFYASKNWCYSKEHEPLNELKSIQNRIDLSRSIVLLTAVAIQLMLLFMLVFFIFFIKRIFREDKDDSEKIYLRTIRNIFYRATLLLIVILFLSKECYKICQLSYNKRAFGYYVSYLEEGKDEKKANEKKDCCLPCIPAIDSGNVKK
ncbi:MAG: hypothetical protein QM737_10345 [Ferruginibacter sp.]